MAGYETFRAESPEDLLLLLLYAPGRDPKEPVDGATRLQKMVFLLQQDLSPRLILQDARSFDFRAFRMGPYSQELSRAVDELVAGGLIAVERLRFWLNDDSDAEAVSVSNETEKRGAASSQPVESLRFMIAPGIGERAAEELWNGLPRRARDELRQFKRFFNSLSLRQLLIYTYQRFPDFATESEIKGQLGLTSERS